MRLSRLVAADVLMLVVTVLAGAAEPKPNDFGEVVRRGDLVEHIGGEDRMSGADSLYAQAVDGLPEKDTDKWFVYVVGTKGCAACSKLVEQWKTDPILRAYAKPEAPKESWAHFHYYSYDDPKQAWRWKDPNNPHRVAIKAFPTIVVQPPLSGKWGDSATIIYQGVYEGDPRKLQSDINGAIRLYLDKLHNRQSGQPYAERSVESGFESNGYQQRQIPPLILPGEDLPNPDRPQYEPRHPRREPRESFEVREQIVIVKDPEQVYGTDEEQAIRQTADDLQPALHKLRVREIEMAKAAKLYDVQPDEVPVVLRVEGGEVREKRSPRVSTDKGWGPLMAIWFGFGGLISIFFYCVGIFVLVLFWGFVIWLIVLLLRKLGAIAPKGGWPQQPPAQPPTTVVVQQPVAATSEKDWDAMIAERKRQLYEELTAQVQAAKPGQTVPAKEV